MLGESVKAQGLTLCPSYCYNSEASAIDEFNTDDSGRKQEAIMTSAVINGVTIHYQVSGEGPAVTLLHGYTGSHQDWVRQIPLLSKKYRVVTLDWRGHGKSEALSAASDYSFELLIQDTYGLLRHLGIHTSCIVGHSMGGFIALELALRYPDVVSALVLVDSGRV